MNIHLTWALLGKIACGTACVTIVVIIGLYAFLMVEVTGWDVFWENLKPDWYVRRQGARKERRNPKRPKEERT